MPLNQNDLLRMYMLMGITDSSKAFLKDRFPNMTYVLEHPDPVADNQDDEQFNRDLFKQIDPDIYGSFHNYLKTLNGNSTTAPPVVEHTPLQNAYTAAGAMVKLADSAMPVGLWTQGSQHPPSGTVISWAGKLTYCLEVNL